ncbi:MAG: diguanylate cyclase [Candidatus Omnitrophota bacterium]|nr:diguanylate cyclase [Candidatus Omnitrophota bacterium]
MVAVKKKVLLAEHEAGIAEIIQYLLKAWDYEIITIAKGFAVLDAVRREQPDIIIIDWGLPDMDGLKVSKALKEDFLTAHIPIIVLIDKKQIRKKMLEIEQGVDDYIANPPDPIDLEIRMELALRRTSHQLYANALTKLPGNRQIEKAIYSRMGEKKLFSVAYYDIDNFKSFNDKYGYMKGDSVIRHVAYIISTTTKRYGNPHDFVGHIGGDDFVVVTTPDKDRLIASESILAFNRAMHFHYSKEDRERTYIVSKDRRGNVMNMPLMSVSIAIANNKYFPIKNMVELMETITEIKSYLKTLPGSNFLVNRRQIEKKLFIDEPVKAESAEASKEERLRHKPLGQILLESQVITPEQLELALNRHWNTGQRIGQSVISLGLASSGDIARALESQFNIPHFDIRNLSENGELKEIVSKISFDIMKDYGVLPVRKDKNVLLLAMLDPKNMEALAKIKSLTGCSVTPLFVLENEFTEILDRIIVRSKA